MSKSDKEDEMFVYVGAYETEVAANEDYDTFMELRKEGFVGSYDVGIVSKNGKGKLEIKRRTDSTKKGAKRGLAVGVLLGVIFPPSILASGVIGAGAGTVIGRSFNDISKDDLKEIGDYLEDNEAALVIIAESKLDEMVAKATKSALKEYKKAFNADAKEYNKELDAAIKQL